MATLNAGSGADGNATVSADTDISTTSLVGRGNADMVSYQCTSVGTSACVTSATPNGIAAGDEVLLLSWQGTSSNYEQVGNYETFTVDDVTSNTITFSTSKTKFYGDTSGTDSCTGGTATASNSTGSNTPDKAFDDNTGTFWQTQTSNPWIKYELSSAATIVKYSIQNATFTAQTPQAWTFEGSNNDSDWTVLDTVTGVTSWSSTETKTYRCDATGSYLYYRINISADNDGGGDEVILSNISMYAATDTNVGTSSSNQRVIVQRIPQYNNLTVDNGYTLTGPDAWDNFGGVFFIRVAGTATINGSISMTGRGYTGGYNNYSGQWYYRTGASYTGGPRSAAKSSSSWFTASNAGGGARGGHNGSFWACGAGGGYGTAGEDGQDGSYVYQTQGGATYGDAQLTKLFNGSGGGTGEEPGEESGDTLADGGGIIAIFANTLDVYGSVVCNGQKSVPQPSLQNWPGGAGAGGSILIHAGTIYTRSSTFTATGAAADETPQPGSYSGGDGGDGRIAIHYATLGDSLASVDPTPYTDSGLQLPYSIAGTISENCTVRVYDQSWNFIKQEAATGGSYTVSNLPNAGPFHVVALPGTSSKNALIYRDVVPTQ
jgi:hypothetical protein